MEATGEPQESAPPSPPAPMAERLGNSVSEHEHEGDPAGPANNGPSENEPTESVAGAEDGAVDEEGTDALTVGDHVTSERAVIGDHSDRLSKQYLQRTSELRGQSRSPASSEVSPGH